MPTIIISNIYQAVKSLIKKDYYPNNLLLAKYAIALAENDRRW